MLSALLMLRRGLAGLALRGPRGGLRAWSSRRGRSSWSSGRPRTRSANWNVVDAAYFAVATLTTTSVADPDLVLEDGWRKVFTILFQLVGIGILVESFAGSGSRSW